MAKREPIKAAALVGDIYISLIVTCQLNKVDPFDYLTKVQQHAAAAKATPAAGYRGPTRRHWRPSRWPNFRPRPTSDRQSNSLAEAHETLASWPKV